jgi:hypothetical protein
LVLPQSVRPQSRKLTIGGACTDKGVEIIEIGTPATSPTKLGAQLFVPKLTEPVSSLRYRSRPRSVGMKQARQ